MEREDTDGRGDPRGFDGLSSLVSDLGDLEFSSDTADGQGRDRSTDSDHRPQNRTEPNRKRKRAESTAPPSREPADGGPMGMLVGGTAVVLAFVWLVATSSSTPPAPSSTSTDRAVPAADNPFTDLYSSDSAEATRASERAGERSLDARLDVGRPPPGRDRILSVAEIRYCTAESIRIDGADPEVDARSELEVSAFNRRVEDYNSRCGEFRYREGTLERARSDVAPFHGELLQQGRNRFLREVGRLSDQASPDPTVREAQRLLNVLGYGAGPEDGIFGPRTHTAVIAFQENHGGTIDGAIDDELLQRLRRAVRNR